MIRLLCSLALLLCTSGPAPQAVAVFHRPIVRVGANQSNNWSGYNQGTLEKGNVQFHHVSSTWTVPTATQHTPGVAESSATWVGIGGGCIDAGCTVTDATLIQAGTSQNVDASGVASYDAWWELIPAPSVTISGFAVRAGDVMFVDINETLPGMWTITVTNRTTGRTFTQTAPYSSSYATAEWIEETPIVVDNSGAVGIAHMPNLGSVHFTGSQVNGHSAGLVPSEAIQLVDSNKQVLATPSAPNGDAFNDCTYSGSCAAP